MISLTEFRQIRRHGKHHEPYARLRHQKITTIRQDAGPWNRTNGFVWRSIFPASHLYARNRYFRSPLIPICVTLPTRRKSSAAESMAELRTCLGKLAHRFCRLRQTGSTKNAILGGTLTLMSRQLENGYESSAFGTLWLARKDIKFSIIGLGLMWHTFSRKSMPLFEYESKFSVSDLAQSGWTEFGHRTFGVKHKSHRDHAKYDFSLIE